MEEKYKRMFSRVKASPEKIQEVIIMTEKRRPRKIVRSLLVTAVIMALAVLTAMGANAASGGELFAKIVSYTTYTAEDGTEVAEMEVELDDKMLEGNTTGSFEIVQGEDGKAVMTYTDENGKKVTQEIDLEDADDITGQLQEKADKK